MATDNLLAQGMRQMGGSELLFLLVTSEPWFADVLLRDFKSCSSG